MDTDTYLPSEVEAIARLILRDLPIRVAQGDWWTYRPGDGIVTYPPLFLEAWPGPRVVGALLHEVAEVLYSGPEAVKVGVEFAKQAMLYGCSVTSARLLLNAVNDLRVNRLYLAAYPGSKPFLGAVYTAEIPLERQDDFPAEGRPTGGLPHHQLLDALTRRWAKTIWPNAPQAEVSSSVERALRRLWPAAQRALAAESLALCAEIIADEMLSIYAELVQESREIYEDPSLGNRDRRLEGMPPEGDGEPEEGVRGEESVEGEDVEADAPGASGGSPSAGYAADSATVYDRDEKDKTRQEEAQVRRVQNPDGERISVGRAGRPELWPSSTIFRVRQSRRNDGPDYERFDYFAAVRRLEPVIKAALEGHEAQLGLTQILNLRRFGTEEPWRRPRRRVRGDSGELDTDHPESLVVDPSVAFLRGTKRRRDDGQKDFANVILLDVSGSIVQRGYPSRKFALLVDTLVVFCELHERLKLPYSLAGFSESATLLRAFGDSVYAHQHVDPASAYVVKDFGYLVKDLYLAEHGETREALAIESALDTSRRQRGLKTLLVVTDGISSDRPALTRLLVDMEERNYGMPVSERVKVLAFGVGLAEEEFKASYQPSIDGRPLRSASGELVPDVEALPGIVCRAIEARIREA